MGYIDEGVPITKPRAPEISIEVMNFIEFKNLA